MRRARFSLIVLGALALLAGCHRKDEPPKILEGLPPNTKTTVVPAKAAQEMTVLQRDAMSAIFPVINQFGLLTPHYPTLTPVSFGKYSTPIAGPRYGNATVQMEFKNGGTTIDPVATQGSSMTLTNVVVTVDGSGNQFNYHEDMLLTLQTPGNIGDRIRLTGTSHFTGLCDITYTFTSPGPTASFQGLSNGAFTGSGTDEKGAPTAVSLTLNTDHDANGTITWQGETDGFHLNSGGPGFITTSTDRIFVP